MPASLLCSHYISGLVKNHFYYIWVQNNILQKTKELHLLHKILRDVSTTFQHSSTYDDPLAARSTCTTGMPPQSDWRTCWWFFDSRPMASLCSHHCSFGCKCNQLTKMQNYNDIEHRFLRFGMNSAIPKI